MDSLPVPIFLLVYPLELFVPLAGGNNIGQ